jgi:hypothetical protein
MRNPNDYTPAFNKVFNELTDIEKRFGSDIVKTIAAKLILKFVWFRWSDLRSELINEFKTLREKSNVTK